MKFNNLIVIAFIIVALQSMLYAGTAYYVDPSAVTNGNGTYSSPWNDIGSINNHSFSTGDDVYFKVNTTCTPSVRLLIDWGGSSGDRAIIGAYYGNGQFGLNGNNRPVIDGQNSVPSGNEAPLIGAIGYDCDYVTIKDLKVINSAGYGIIIKFGDNGIIENCHTDHTYRLGIGLARTINGIISDNIVNDTYYWHGAGDCIDVTGAGQEGSSQYNLVTRNVVSNCNEGIGAYQKAMYTTIEYNVIYDSDYSIYSGGSKYNIFRYNLIYTTDSPERNRGRGICLDNEAQRNYCFSGDAEIYGNIIANMTQGIFISNACGYNNGAEPYPNCDTSCNMENILIYNNTLVDNDININIRRDDAGWNGNEIKNNIFLTITGGTVHANKFSPAGFTWSHNLFDDAVSGNAANNAIIGNPALTKTSGWRSLTIGNVDGTEFALTGVSDAIDAGIPISGYNDRISTADFTANPISVTISLDSNPDIGAWKYTNGGVNTAPVVNAGADQTITLPAQAALDGTVTDDNLPNPPASVTIAWTKQSGPGTVIFGNANAEDTTASFSEAGTYVLRLTANDSELQTSDEVTITVNPPVIPKTYTAYIISSPPFIDGNIEEYVNANTLNINGTNANGTYRILYDSDALYIAAEVDDPEFNAEHTTRDANIWEDDCIELLFDTLNNAGGSMGAYDYKYYVNLYNTQRDYRGVTGASWNISFDSEVYLDGTLNNNADTDNTYTIEIAIPWSSWGISAPGAGETCGFDIALNDTIADSSREQTVWSNSDGGNPNTPDGWGELVFSSTVVDGNDTNPPAKPTGLLIIE